MITDHIQKLKKERFDNLWKANRTKLIELSEEATSDFCARVDMLEIQLQVNLLLGPAARVSYISPPLKYGRSMAADELYHDWYVEAWEYAMTSKVTDRYPGICIENRGDQVLRISNARRWYCHARFIDWLNAPGTATWHHKGKPIGDDSYAFTMLDGIEGSDCPGYGKPEIPHDIWVEILEASVHAAGPDGMEAVVVLSGEEPNIPPTALDLAGVFAFKMQEEVGEEQLMEADTKNAVEKVRGICHVHELCDANMVMAAAFNEVHNQEPNAVVDPANRLWNAAWEICTRYGFNNMAGFLRAERAEQPVACG